MATPQGEVAEAAEIDLGLPAAASPTQLKLVAELVAGKKRFANDWTAWLYPAAIKPAALPVPVFAEPDQLAKLPPLGSETIAGGRRFGRSRRVRHPSFGRPAAGRGARARRLRRGHQRPGPPLELPLRGLRDKLVERNGKRPGKLHGDAGVRSSDYPGDGPARLVRRGMELLARRRREALFGAGAGSAGCHYPCAADDGAGRRRCHTL